MTEQEMRNKVVETARSYLGCKEANGTHKPIIDIYNLGKTSDCTYKMQYTDHWCATFASAMYIKCGFVSIIACECSCSRMITKFKKMGTWVENDAYVPSPGDFILYDWDDSGVGDCTGNPEHVGLVETVTGNSFTVIEGNMSDAVGRRNMKINGRYIRGFGVPQFSKLATPGTTVTTTAVSSKTTNTVPSCYVVKRGDTLSKIAAAYSLDYKYLAELNDISNPNIIKVGQKLYFRAIDKALDHLTYLGVITSPDYWRTFVDSGKVSYVEDLIIKCSEKITGNGNRISAEAGIQAMIKAGIMNSPDYWRNVCKTTSIVGELIGALGGAL